MVSYSFVFQTIILMPQSGLTTEQLEFWEKNGYLIIPDAISREVVEELVSETGKLLNG